MMKRLIYIWLMLAPLAGALAHDGEGRDDPKYPVSDIAPELLEDAYLVVRKSDELFTINSIGKSVYRHHIVFTIMNEKADHHALLRADYDMDSEVEEFSAWVYDNTGKEIDKLKKSEIKDQSLVSGGNLYDDNRVLYSDLSKPDYPYTIEVIREWTKKETLRIPNFFPQTGENISVESATYRLVVPPQLIPRYREVNYDGEFKKEELNGEAILQWEIGNLKPVEAEPMSQGIFEFVPYVQIAPNRFELNGYEGDMSTWENYGKWIWNLNQGRDKISEKTAEEVKKITAGLTQREKVKAVYEYMQNRTRYVSVQLGIGGLQPFDAKIVDEVGYGDCKALSNYTYSLLKSVGIHSIYTIVEAGTYPNPVRKDFPSNPFNHVILSVPLDADTVWLECTSQTNPFNYLGTFTSDRDVLLITEDGGKLVKTPKYSVEDNVRSRKAQVLFDDEGNATVSEYTIFKGIQNDLYVEGIIHDGKEPQKRWIQNSINLPNFDIKDFEFNHISSEIPETVLDLKITTQKYASRTGKRFYFNPNLMSRLSDGLKPVSDRKTQFSIKYPLAYVDTIEYKFPSSFQLEYIQKPVNIESDFGSYSSSVKFEQGRLIYYRNLKLKKGTFDPDMYNDFIEFIDKVKDADKSKVVFTTKT